jgi:hypothetical protein
MSTPEDPALNTMPSHLVADALLARLREAIATLDAGEDDTWTPDNPQPFTDPAELADDDREPWQRFEDAWSSVWRIVQELEAAGCPRVFTESDCTAVDVAGLTFIGRFDREITFGPVVFEQWNVDNAGDAQQASSGFIVEMYEDEHGLPTSFFQRLGFERTESDFPCNYDEACAWFGLDDGDNVDDEDDDADAEA